MQNLCENWQPHRQSPAPEGRTNLAQRFSAGYVEEMIESRRDDIGSPSALRTPISPSQLTFESGNKPIRLDAYVPNSNKKLPAVLALYGSGGGVSGMNEPAALLAAQGFAVFE